MPRLAENRLRRHPWGTVLLTLAAAACATKPTSPPAPVADRSEKTQAEASTPLREAGADSLEPLLHDLEEAQTAALTAPDDQDRWVRLAALFTQAFRTQEAARAAWRAVEIEPNFFSWTSLGNVLTQGDILMSMGASVGAFQAYSMAAQQATEPQLAARNFLNLAYRDFGLGHDQQALELIAEAEKLSPSDPMVYFDKACVLSAGGQTEAAQAQANKALALLNDVAPGQTPADPALAQMRPLAEAIVRGEPVVRPGLLSAGEMLPERFWAKPPNRGSALSLPIDEASDRFFPLVPGVAMRLRVPSTWAHRQKVTEKAIHLRLAPPDGEAASYAEITLFPTLKENFNLKQAAEAGRQSITQPHMKVGALMPIERKEGLAFWFESHDPSAKGVQPKAGSYARIWQGFAFTRPFVMSATWFGQRHDQPTQDSLLAMMKSFEVFRMETPQ